MGHILPQFGKDWTHKGIAKLYHKIHQYVAFSRHANVPHVHKQTQDFLSLLQKRLQVLVLLGEGDWHGGHHQGLPAVGQRQRNRPPQRARSAGPQQPLLSPTQVNIPPQKKIRGGGLLTNVEIHFFFSKLRLFVFLLNGKVNI